MKITSSFVVMSNDFDDDWPTWEVHPKGDEIVRLSEPAQMLFVTPGEGTENQQEPGRDR